MPTESPTFQPSHADNCRAGELKWRGVPPGMPAEIADALIAKLRDGSTIRKLTCGMKQFGPAMVPWGRFKKHCELHPDWAAMAWRISKANTAKGKGTALRLTTHCRAGLHLMTGSNVFIDGSHGRRRCLACRRIASAYAPPMADDVADRVKQALENGATLTQITSGKPAGGGKRNPKLIITSFKIIRRYRQENPDFNRFVVSAISDSLVVGQRIRHQRRLNAAKREEANDYHSIRSLLPASFPDKDDVVSAIFEDLLTGSLKRENVRARVQTYITAHNRMFPTKYARFGDSPLVSLDEVMFDGGTTTRGETVSRGLWD